MIRKFLTHPCIRWTLFAAFIGICAVAYGEDPNSVASAGPTSLADLTLGQAFEWLLKAGLPASLTYLGYTGGRQARAGIPVVITLSSEDRTLLRKLIPKD